MKRVVIVGTSGSGKTTLGRQISHIFNIPHRDIDSFNWQENWQALEKSQLRDVLNQFTDQEEWIIDGNYGSVKDITWKKATHIIWLDYKLPFVLKRFFIRSFKRSYTKEILWNNNRETLKNSIWGKESLFLWIFKTHHKLKKEYSTYQESPIYSAKFIRLIGAKETEAFIAKLTNK
ncbi:hypothetical protein N9N67_07770 [Bacteriovoracaceae bacterium]|nr:hypothetical protein [Bacteriovoracaceae bacterium]